MSGGAFELFTLLASPFGGDLAGRRLRKGVLCAKTEAMIILARTDPDRLQATRRIKAWTRERFRLRDGAVVTAAEVACPVPGCPPIETIVVFWTEDGSRHRFKVFKPIAEVVYDDLPYAWLLGALVDDGLGLECC